MGLTQKLGTIPLAVFTDSSNNVGIGGAANASYKLAVTGASLFTGALTATGQVEGTIINSTSNAFRLSGNNALSLVTLNSQSVVKINAAGFWGTQLVGANDSGILVANTGSTGIGTTPPTTANFQHLFVGKNISMFSGSGTDIYFGSNFYYDGSFRNRYSEAAAMINTNEGAFIFQNSSTGTAGGAFSGVERMRLTNGGNLGINNNNPQSYLDVSNNGTSTNAYIIARNTGVAGYRSGAIFVNAATGGLNWYLVSTNNSDGDWGGGKFAISTNNATGVYLNGSTATTWTGQSDIRLKDVDSEIEDAINKVNQLRGVRFTWKSDESKKMQVGLIAQEVKEVLPEAVDFDDTNEDYKMGVQYTDVIPLLVNAIKELSAKVTALENQ